jgi:hypothetical protein
MSSRPPEAWTQTEDFSSELDQGHAPPERSEGQPSRAGRRGGKVWRASVHPRRRARRGLKTEAGCALRLTPHLPRNQRRNRKHRRSPVNSADISETPLAAFLGTNAVRCRPKKRDDERTITGECFFLGGGDGAPALAAPPPVSGDSLRSPPSTSGGAARAGGPAIEGSQRPGGARGPEDARRAGRYCLLFART